MNSRFRRCCTSIHQGRPSVVLPDDVPGWRAMKPATPAWLRRSCATATATSSPTQPMGISQRRLIHRARPIRTLGAIPAEAGSEPAHVCVSITSSPRLRCAR
ncbi:MAG: hypothetical protein FWE71_10245 [Nocardioidaceae bacterium]|nr:hypothetical protein [Nocardioidaceae bacterium]MCL2614238.1 hypothetical protein [Nocardioidaceae bacterium]